MIVKSVALGRVNEVTFSSALAVEIRVPMDRRCTDSFQVGRDDEECAKVLASLPRSGLRGCHYLPCNFAT